MLAVERLQVFGGAISNSCFRRYVPLACALSCCYRFLHRNGQDNIAAGLLYHAFSLSGNEVGRYRRQKNFLNACLSHCGCGYPFSSLVFRPYQEMRRLIEGPASFKGVFKGFSAFLAQVRVFIGVDRANWLTSGKASMFARGCVCTL